MDTHEPRGVQIITGVVQDVGNSTSLNGSAGARAGKSQMKTKHAYQFISHAKIMRIKR